MPLSRFISQQGTSQLIRPIGGLSGFTSSFQQPDEVDYTNRIANAQQRLMAVGQPLPEPENKDTILDKIFNTLNFLNLQKNRALSFLSGNTEAFSEDISGADLLQQWGMNEGVGNQIAGFAFDLLTDPLNFLTFGTAGAATSAAKAGIKSASKADDVLKGIDDLTKAARTTNTVQPSQTVAKLGAFGRYWEVPNSGRVINALGSTVRGAASSLGRFVERLSPELAQAGREVRDTAGRLFSRGYGIPESVAQATQRSQDLFRMDVGDTINEVTGIVKGWKNVDHLKVIKAVENPSAVSELNPNEAEAFRQVKDFFDYYFLKAQEYGIIDEFRENYIPHIFKGKKEAVAEALEQLRRRGARVQTNTGFARERTILEDISTILENPELASKLKPETDLAKIMGIYKISLQKAIRNREMLDELVHLGPDVIRKVGEEGVEIPESWVKAPIAQLRGYAVPPDIARHLKDITESFTNSDSANKLFRLYDEILGWWKGMATIPNPGFHFRNVLGNIFNNYLGGVRSIEPYKLATQAIRANDTTLENFYDLVRAGDNAAGIIPGEQIAMQRVFNEPRFREVLTGGDGPKIKVNLGNRTVELNMTGVKFLAKLQGVVGRGFISGDISNSIDDVLRRLRSQRSIQDFNPLSRESMLFRLAESAGTTVEDHARLAHFIDRLQKGDTPLEAGLSVKKYLFDYSSLTPFERNVMRRFIPFYAFTRFNLPLQLKELVKQPKYAALMGKFQNFAEALSEEVTGEDIEKGDLPRYLRDLYSIRLPFQVGGRDVTLGVDLPIRDVNSLRPQDWFSMMTPLLTVPFEQIANRNVYFDRDLESYEGQTVRAPGYLQGLFRMIQAMDEDSVYSETFNRIANHLGFTVGINEETGQPELRVPVRISHLLNQFVAAKNAGKLADVFLGEAFDPFGVSSMLTGISASSSTRQQREQQRQREEYSRLEDLLRKLRDEGSPVPTLRELEQAPMGMGRGLSRFLRG